MCLPRGDTSGYHLSLPASFDGDPWEWFADQGQLGANPYNARTKAARGEIRKLGYGLGLAQADLSGWTAIVSKFTEVRPAQAVPSHMAHSATTQQRQR